MKKKIKLYLVTCIDEWDGQCNVESELFTDYKKAKGYKGKLIADDEQFVDDVKDLIDEGNCDCQLTIEDDYFYCYDGINFDAKTITIEEKEIDVEVD